VQVELSGRGRLSPCLQQAGFNLHPVTSNLQPVPPFFLAPQSQKHDISTFWLGPSAPPGWIFWGEVAEWPKALVC
jgi:hypothetical protein